MAQLSNREKERLKTLLETDMDRIEGRLNEVQEELDTKISEIRDDLNSVRTEVKAILGIDDVETSPPRRKAKAVAVSPHGNKRRI